MTDDSRFRAPRAQGLPPTPHAPGGRVRRTEDPLAELARLIGQEDPFADFVAQRPVDSRAAAPAGAQRRPHSRDTRPVDPRSLERRRPAIPARSMEAFDDFDGGLRKDDHARDESRRAFSKDERVRGDDRSAHAYGGNRTQRSDDIPAASTRSLRDDTAIASRKSARPGRDRLAPAFDRHDSEFGLNPSRQARETRSARRAFAPQPAGDGYAEYAATDYDPEYDDDAYLPAHGDEFYEEAPRRRLKPWMLVGVAAFVAIAVGTSGLFAYRALFGIDDAAGPTRIISPAAGPTKLIPGSTSQSADNKRIQDRVGGEPTRNAERIVPREENPIDESRIPQSGSGDRVPAGTVTAAPQFSAAPSQAEAAPVTPANISTEPRRVRTVTVRADGSVVPDASRAAVAANAGRTGPAGAAQTSGNPLALQGQGAVQPPQRPAGTVSSAPLQGDNPWSSISAGQLSGPATQAALPPQSAPAQSAPTPAIAVQTPPPAGSYVVQVAAQKTEGEAQASWQSLQQRYSSVLGAQQATIRRVDLGERGVFYRAQVGPFSTRAQASEVCQSLKAAGGECVIQRN